MIKHLLSKSKVGKRFIKVLPVKTFEMTGERYVENWWLESYQRKLRDGSILRRASRKVCKRLIPCLNDVLEDNAWDFSVVNNPIGEYQNEYGYYVDKYCNGGYSGDDYQGWICFPMKNGKFLKFHYSC